MGAQENQLVMGVIILGIIMFIWVIAYYQPKKMVPMYYGPYDANGAPRVSAWQQTTQGGIPNIIDGRGPSGEPLGIFDYLGYSMSGRNNVPGNLEWSGYKDCGCGCGGQKAAMGAVDQVASALPLSNSNIDKIPPKSAASSAPSTNKPANKPTKGFGAHPMDIHEPGAWCHAGSVVGGRSDCDSSSATPLQPLGAAKQGLKTFASRFFGSASSDRLAETVGTVNSGRTLGRVYDSDSFKQSLELGLAIGQIPYAAAQTDAAFTSIATAAANTSATDKNRINAHIDSPVNNPRRPLSTYVPGGYAGLHEVSSIDHRGRGV